MVGVTLPYFGNMLLSAAMYKKPFRKQIALWSNETAKKS